MKLTLSILSIQIFFSLQSFGQDSHIRFLAKHCKDSVILRWAPSNSENWEEVLKYGFRLERLELGEQDVPIKAKPMQLGPDSIRPMSLENWAKAFPPGHPYAWDAAQAFYGKQFNVKRDVNEASNGSVQNDDNAIRFSRASLLADQDAAIARAMGLRWCDKTKGKAKVVYRLISLNPTRKDTAVTEIDFEKPAATTPIPPFVEAESGFKSVKLRWNAGADARQFSAFRIEKSLDFSSTWNLVSPQPIPNAHHAYDADTSAHYVYFTDSLISENYKPIYYRIQGITPFAESSYYSAVVIAMGQDKNAPPLAVIKEVRDIGGKLQVRWDYPSLPPDFAEFRIGRSVSNLGPFTRVSRGGLADTSRSWTDSEVDTKNDNCYVVYAYDKSGLFSVSLPANGFLLDSIVPGKLDKPKGSIDSNGVVRLHWKAGADEDIMGYRVFMMVDPKKGARMLTPMPIGDTSFVDTIPLNTGARNIFLSVAAVDRAYNMSAQSDKLMLIMPDTIRPLKPRINGFKVKGEVVDLQLLPSTSPDVKEYRLLRRDMGQDNWSPIHTWNRKEFKKDYRDTSVKSEAAYQYMLIAADSAGNISDMDKSLSIRVVPIESRDDVKNLRAAFNKGKKMVTLDWVKPNSPVDHYIVYRGKDGSLPLPFTKVEGNLNHFEDIDYPGKGKYRYMLKVVYRDLGESSYSVAEEIDVE